MLNPKTNQEKWEAGCSLEMFQCLWGSWCRKRTQYRGSILVESGVVGVLCELQRLSSQNGKSSKARHEVKACNSSLGESETRGLWDWGQSGLQSKILTQKKILKKRNGFSEKVQNGLQEMLMSVFCAIVKYKTFCVRLISTVSYGLSKVDILAMSKFSPNA